MIVFYNHGHSLFLKTKDYYVFVLVFKMPQNDPGLRKTVTYVTHFFLGESKERKSILTEKYLGNLEGIE